MKNLLIFVTPKKRFPPGEPELLVKIQIDNSLDLGWKREDLILATNFDFEYNGVKSVTVGDDNFLPYSRRGSKNKVILELFDRGLLNNKEVYWFHDLDAYQSESITESELEMGNADMALTDYCWREKWNTGSVFFKTNAEDIYRSFVETHNIIRTDNDEVALMVLTNGLSQAETDDLRQKYGPRIFEKIPKVKDISKRILKINTTYNFLPWFNTRHCYETAIKPIKVVHFHLYCGARDPRIPSLLNFYMYGDNEINTVFMSERLIKIFRHHGIKHK